MLSLLAAILIGTPSWTVDGVDYPACVYEDGSDSASLPCVWTDPDTGRQWLTFADRSLPITP
jgi:hypothetical protein